MQSDKATDSLLEAIRKELNDILVEEESQSRPQRIPQVEPKSDPSSDDAVSTNSFSPSTTSSKSASKKTLSISRQMADQLGNSEAAKRADFLNDTASKTINANVQKMTVNLEQSYELFTSINERFERINFGNLKTRIKNLQLGAAAAAGGGDADLREMFEKSYMEKRLDSLTSDMSKHLRQHPGEFADIPEVSEFFQACSQLQSGLKQLKKQREEVHDIENQLTWATEVSFDRADEIRKAMTKDNGDGYGRDKELPEE